MIVAMLVVLLFVRVGESLVSQERDNLFMILTKLGAVQTQDCNARNPIYCTCEQRTATCGSKPHVTATPGQTGGAQTPETTAATATTVLAVTTLTTSSSRESSEQSRDSSTAGGVGLVPTPSLPANVIGGIIGGVIGLLVLIGIVAVVAWRLGRNASRAASDEKPTALPQNHYFPIAITNDKPNAYGDVSDVRQ